MYNGYAVSTGKLCPLGWHVPTIDEWLILTNYSGDKMAGGNLKEIHSWMSPNAGATNATGFKALPGGSRGNRGSFLDIGLCGHWWSSTEDTSSDIQNRTMSYSDSDVTGTSDHKKSGSSFRCLKNNKRMRRKKVGKYPIYIYYKQGMKNTLFEPFHVSNSSGIFVMPVIVVPALKKAIEEIKNMNMKSYALCPVSDKT